MNTIKLQNIDIPAFIYGTAWKEDATASLVELAIKSGFRGIDTANQRKHYFEEAVGVGLKAAYEKGYATRDDMFLQTKFTFANGQDERKPYDPSADITTQVAQSFASSQEHLGTDVMDSYVLHGPSTGVGLRDKDFEAWAAMESLYQSKKTKLLGVSNVNLEQLEAFTNNATVKPAFVQNRCYASTRWDQAIRHFCRDHGIVYQGFSLLTANGAQLQAPDIKKIADDHGMTIAQIIFRFSHQIGMLPLTGTSNENHMLTDLAIFDFELSSQQMTSIENIG